MTKFYADALFLYADDIIPKGNTVQYPGLLTNRKQLHTELVY